MKLYLDDERPVPSGWWGVKTAPEAIRFLEAHHVEFVSLDHDLGEGKGTGYDVVRYIEEQCVINPNYLPPRMYCHSANPPGKTAIESCIKWIETHIETKVRDRQAGYEVPSPPPPFTEVH